MRRGFQKFFDSVLLNKTSIVGLGIGKVDNIFHYLQEYTLQEEYQII